MINAANESDYLWRGLRALIGFRLAAAKAWLAHGHFVRRDAIQKYLAEHNVRKLHLGATQQVPGFLNSQITGTVPIDIGRKIPFPDDSINLIYSSHLVEHIHRKEFLAFLGETRRILRPGGRHLFATPSLARLAKLLYSRDPAEREAVAALLAQGERFFDDGFFTACHQFNLTMRAFGHRFLYDLDFVREAGLRTGYASVRLIDNFGIGDEALDAYLAKSKSPRWAAETETFELVK
jgi:predicted SAM-dependent methyltransferase